MSLLVHKFVSFITREFMTLLVDKQVLPLLVHAFVYSSV